MQAVETQKQVLIIDRDVAGIEPLRRCLGEAGLQVRVIAEVHAAIATICTRPPELLMVDWDIPGIGAHQLLRNLRDLRLPPTTRLIIVSALGGEDHVVAALTLGADDFIGKPLSLREAVARVSRMLRSGVSRQRSTAYRFEELEAHPAAGSSTDQGGFLDPRRIECRLLEFLMLHGGRTFSRQQLLNQVWGGDADVDERTVDVNVQRLRKLLAVRGYESCVETVRGFGYRFTAPAAEPAAATPVKSSCST